LAYIAVREFYDTQYGDIRYRVGQPYPSDGIDVKPSHIDYLLSDANQQRKTFIKFVPDAETDEEVAKVFPNHIGGGKYELSNGEKVKGKEVAIEAENALKVGE
jgi:hypothetical protein